MTNGVSDQEIEEAHAKVRRHQWQSRLSMGAAVLAALPFFALGLIFHVFFLIPGMIVGGAVWKALRPKSNNPLDYI